ncbi:MAG TPA: cell division protein FtsH [Elusimicrobia bacterium]|nr:MAG: cell division protein FtsH [Elusimicrobia bacterium RIFOXYA12_FULL_49_49]OGS14761.1 MAG: cell division protein FtsH [Elusimicrobia bacterium RIFOXYA2_FULL_47_53]OGS25588.1 MAG: cell division protein FtsH [Elusimicrobia bacterium RIFOXYB12_FULL_50_12]OGS28955.1 MAG: cell division protein FtsH [Elusimicrobia bacterium RIFOXYB2_FULL_46_23]HBU69603.1 cell division protein FtsH [Elusimicrobiota bacterium]
MKDKNKWGLLAWVFIFLLLLYFIQSVRQINVEQELPYSTFKKYIKAGEIIKVTVAPELIKGQYKAADGKVVNFKTVPMPDPKLVEDMEQYNVSQFSGNLERGWLMPFLMNWGPMVLLILFWLWMIKGMQGGGKQVMAFGRSKAKLQTAKKTKITFADVAGCDEAKEELKEIVEFLKDPAKFQKLGGKIPKGVLVYGSPGTGKTLLAKAVAGEAGVPFFSSSGSEFVEMFVGVGASRVRDLFEQGRRSAPCLLFIDEIDAVGRHRFAGIGGGHDEREQTLNQLLVEMDGFDTKEGVILIAATNRPDVLDPALLRPGRFDRQIAVPMPDLKGRDEILKVHAKSIKLADEVNLNVIARRTPGFVGADIANLVNEAALLAARKERQSVGMDDLEEAIDRVIAGPQRKSRMISDREKKIIAYHESGHALVAKITPGSDPVHKVSIIPRGPALGYTLQLPLEDKYLTTRQEIQGKLAVLLGGRVAEEMIFNEITTGAQNDLSKATSIAHKMVVEFGMSEKIGALSLSQPSEEVFLGRDFNREPKYSNKTAEIIDEEVKRIVTEAKTSAEKILRDNAAKLKALAEKLIEKEILDADEVDRLLNPEAANETKPEEQEKKA